MLPEQVVEPVPAVRGLGDQVLVVEDFHAAAGLISGGVIQRGGGAGVDVGTGVQAQAAEQPPLAGVQVLVGQAERGRDRQVLGRHQGQPVSGCGQVGDQARGVQAGWWPSCRPIIPIASGRYPHSTASSPTAASPGSRRGGRPAGPAARPPHRESGCPG